MPKKEYAARHTTQAEVAIVKMISRSNGRCVDVIRGQWDRSELMGRVISDYLIMEERRRSKRRSKRREGRKRRGRATCRVLWCRKDCTTMYNTTWVLWHYMIDNDASSDESCNIQYVV